MIGSTIAMLFFACLLGENTLQSPQEKDILRTLNQIEAHSAEIESGAMELESFIDQVRRNLQAGASVKEQKQALQERILDLESKRKNLQLLRKQLRDAIQAKDVLLPDAVNASESEDN